MKRIFTPTSSANDWQRLLAKPELHWKQGFSAMTTAASWEGAASRLPLEISRLLSSAGVPALSELDLLAAIPEWQTDLPGGDRPSCTDVLAITRNDSGLCLIAVEAKVLEDFGPRVGEKRKGASKGQLDRIQYLENLLGVRKFDDSIRYQLLHRTASALLTAKQFHAQTAVMLVQAFGTPLDRQNDFRAFCAAINADEICPGLFVVRRFDSPSLYLAWCTGDKKYLAEDLRLKVK